MVLLPEMGEVGGAVLPFCRKQRLRLRRSVRKAVQPQRKGGLLQLLLQAAQAEAGLLLAIEIQKIHQRVQKRVRQRTQQALLLVPQLPERLQLGIAGVCQFAGGEQLLQALPALVAREQRIKLVQQLLHMRPPVPVR